MKLLLVCVLAYFSACSAKTIDPDVLYPPALAPLGNGGLNYRPYYFWRPRSLPLSPFPEDLVGAGAGNGGDDDDDVIRVSVRSSPDGATPRTSGDDTWSYNRKRNDELSRLAMRMLKRSKGAAAPRSGQFE